MSLPTAGDVHVPSATDQPKRKPKRVRDFLLGAFLAKRGEQRKLEPYPGQPGLAKPPFTYDPDFLSRLRTDQVPRFYGALTDRESLPLVEVDLGDLIATQDRVDPVKVQNKRTAGRTGVVVAIGNGELYIVDGHHDLAAQWLNGVDRMGVHFKDLAERSLALKRFEIAKGYNARQPRDANGRWVRVAGGGKVPDLDTSGWGPDGRAAAMRAQALRDAAAAGDIAGARRLSRPGVAPNQYSQRVNDFGDSIIAAMERGGGGGGTPTPPPLRSEIPAVPDTSRWGPQAAGSRRRMNEIHAAATNPDRAAALAAVQAINTTRSNTYARAADDYRTEVLRSLGHSGDTPPTPTNLDAQRELRRTMNRTRQTETRRLDGMDPDLKPRNRPGHNVKNVETRYLDQDDSYRVMGKGREELIETAKAMIADYPGTKFNVEIQTGGGVVEIGFVGDDRTRITRSFRKNAAGELEVYHAYFEAGSQGNGAGKEFFRTSFGQYQKLGVKEVTVKANIDVGTYAWSKYGFKPVSEAAWESTRARASSRLDDLKARREIDTATYNRMKRLVSSPNVDNLAAIADSTLGKKLLINGTVWEGKLRLDDASQMRKFKDYVTRENRGQRAA